MVSYENQGFGKGVFNSSQGRVECELSPIYLKRLLEERLFSEEGYTKTFVDLTNLISNANINGIDIIQELNVGTYPAYLRGIIQKITFNESQKLCAMEAYSEFKDMH